jgi:hypothetical protein
MAGDATAPLAFLLCLFPHTPPIPTTQAKYVTRKIVGALDIKVTPSDSSERQILLTHILTHGHRAGTRVRGSPSRCLCIRRRGQRTCRVVRGGCWGHAPRWPARNRGHGIAARARMRASHWSIRTELMLHPTRRGARPPERSERQPLALSWSWSATPGA